MPSDPCEYCIPASDEAAALLRHGITRVPAAIYQVGGYRYTSLGDAVAQARRLQGADSYFAG